MYDIYTYITEPKKKTHTHTHTQTRVHLQEIIFIVIKYNKVTISNHKINSN